MPYLMRPAVEEDFPAIRSLIRRVRINPIGLDWRRFWVAVDEEGRLIACGQVKPHGDGSRELASIAVIPDWRGKGLARAIIELLLDKHPGQLYLTCRAHLGSFYQRFGFVKVEDQDLPRYFRRIKRMARLVKRAGLTQDEMLVMRRDP